VREICWRSRRGEVQKRVTGATDDRIIRTQKRFLVFCVADELHDIKRNGRIKDTNTKLKCFFISMTKLSCQICKKDATSKLEGNILVCDGCNLQMQKEVNFTYKSEKL
jgi:hypothetical protein